MLITINYTFFLTLALIVMLLNLGVLTGLDFSNAIEKLFFLITVLYLWWKKRITPIVALLCYLVIALTLLSAFFSTNSELSFITTLKSLTQIIIIFFLLGVTLEEKEKTIFAKLISALPVICVLLGILYMALDIRSIVSFEYASGLPRLQGTLIPAYLGGITIAAAYSSLYLAQNYDKKYYYWFAINFILLFLTGGRMALFIGLILFTSYFYLSNQVKPSLKIFITATGITLFILLLILTSGAPVERLLQTHSSGRDIIWEYLFALIEIYEPFGLGFGHQVLFVPDEVKLLTGGTIGAHNEYLRIAVEIGVIPSFLFFLILFTASFIRIKDAQGINRIMILISTVLFGLFCLTDNAIASPHIFLFLIVVIQLSAKKTLNNQILEN